MIFLVDVFKIINLKIFARVGFLSGRHVFLALQFVSLLFFSSQFCTPVTGKVGVLKCCHTDR